LRDPDPVARATGWAALAAMVAAVGALACVVALAGMIVSAS
jgi:hypothetical protein